MPHHLVALAAFVFPVAVGVVAAIVGARQVRFLREKTGDNGTLTKVMSASMRDVAPVSDASRERLAA